MQPFRRTKHKAQAMVFIFVWLTLVVNKYFAVSQCAHVWQIENLAEKNFVEIFGRAKQILSVQCVRTLSLSSKILANWSQLIVVILVDTHNIKQISYITLYKRLNYNSLQFLQEWRKKRPSCPLTAVRSVQTLIRTQWPNFAMKITKNLFKKALCNDKTKWLVLLDYRNTHEEIIASSPAQRMMTRRTKTRMPTAACNPSLFSRRWRSRN